MGKSRKSPSSILRFGPLVLAVLLCGAFATAGIGYVWHRNRNERLAGDNHQRRQQLDELRRHNQALERTLARETTPLALERRARALGLVMPQPEQVLRIDESAGPPPRVRPEDTLRIARQPSDLPAQLVGP
jgi:uncharacterized protein HemX